MTYHQVDPSSKVGSSDCKSQGRGPWNLTRKKNSDTPGSSNIAVAGKWTRIEDVFPIKMVTFWNSIAMLVYQRVNLKTAHGIVLVILKLRKIAYDVCDVPPQTKRVGTKPVSAQCFFGIRLALQPFSSQLTSSPVFVSFSLPPSSCYCLYW